MTTALATPRIREGFTTITPFVTVREAGLLDFLVQTFGAEQTGVTPHHPPGLHREVRVGTSMMMISEGLAGVATKPGAFHVFVEEKSIRDIAAALDRSEGAVKQLQLRALENLRKSMESRHG